MSLSCGCDFNPEDYDFYWEGFTQFKPMRIGRRKRCVSCKVLINIVSDVIEFYNYRRTREGIEEEIYGDSFQLASSFMCEECSGLFLSLRELGYDCLDINEPMKHYVSEHNYLRINGEL